MSKIEEFKSFVKDNPKLIKYVNNGTKTWQNFYEMYDLYGNNNDIWKEYLSEDDNKTKIGKINSVNDVVNLMKNMDVEKVQDSITSLQKALDLFSGLFVKNDTSVNSNNTYTPRPIYRNFED